MTVRFKSQSEYQKSYRVSRSRSVSPQRYAPFAGLRSDQMVISREPGLQHRRRLGPAQSSNFVLRPPDRQPSITEPTLYAHRPAPPAASRSRSAHRRQPSLDPKPPTPPPELRVEPASPADPEPPAGPRPPAGSERAAEPRTSGKSAKPLPSKPDSQPQPSRPVTAAPDGRRPSADEVQHALRLRAGLRSGGQRSGSQRTEYNRQFSWKKPVTAASPVLTAERVLYSSSKSVPPFKKNPIYMETEYQRNFRGLVPPLRPRLRKHLEHQRVPLFHTHVSNKKRREESEKMPRPDQEVTPLPPQVHRGHRIPEEGGETDADAALVNAKEMRQKASLYRTRAWGTNFSRDHLSQLLSEHNALWEPSDTTGSATDAATVATVATTPRLTRGDLNHNPDSRSSSSVEALDLASRSSYRSKRSSAVPSVDTQRANKNARTNGPTPPGPAAERVLAWRGEEEEEEEEEEENTEEEEGRLPTPRLKTRPTQRTHHDVTTPATGGAILVGKLKTSDESPADAAVNLPVTRKEAWSDNNAARLHSSGPAPNHNHHNPASSPPSKPIRTKQAPPSPGGPPPLVPPPPQQQHCIQGTLRHPDFQHNGELGLRFRELQCSGGGCGSDDDDRLSVMSWRSAASCSMASSVLERAQKRRDNFWGKR